MCNFDPENIDKSIQINLLSSHKVTQKWVPQFLRPKNCWQVLSGKWEFESPNKLLYLRDPKIRAAENLSIIGSSRWNNFTFRVRFKLLTDSIKPPEGGTILYFLFRNIRNYYSFHFCLFKKKIEFIKRYCGIWSIIGEHEFDIQRQKPYSVTITTASGVHKCQIDGENVIVISDVHISNGCVGIGAKYCTIEFNHASVSLPSNCF